MAAPPACPQPRPAFARQASLASSALSLPPPSSPSPARSTISLPTLGGGSGSGSDAGSPPPSPLSPGPSSRRREANAEADASDADADADADELTPLLAPADKWHTGPMAVAAVKLALLFLVFTALVVGTFWFGLPRVEDADRGALKLPRSFADLQALNALFQKYKHMYPFRMMACGIVAYLFVQAFSLPGSMYISILFGAAYGLAYGLLLSCLCDSLGSLLCYTLSSLLAPPLLTLPTYRTRLETWRAKLMGGDASGGRASWDSVFAFLIVLRIAPFPPHWVTNFLAPHLGINAFLFWATCFLGIAPVSVIHVTIGRGLDDMTSADDFHILSVRNVLGLVAVAVAVLIPVGLKRVFRKDLGELGDVERGVADAGAPGEPLDADLDGARARQGDAGFAQPYRAVDSGVRLARPSAGDGAKAKRLSTILEDAAGAGSADAGAAAVHPAHAEPRAKAGVVGYGSIGRPVELAGGGDGGGGGALPAPVQARRSRRWWPATLSASRAG